MTTRTATIDPRLRARRTAVRRAEGRKRLHRLGWLLGVTVVIVLGIVATQSPLLDVDHLDVEGATHTGSDTIVEASGLTVGSPMTNVDLGAARSAIADLPWIADVSVQRHWPGTIAIEIVEREPVAAFESDGEGWTVLDASGRVLASRAALPPSLPLLAAEPSTPAPGLILDGYADALAVAAALNPDIAAWVERIEPTGGNGAHLQLAGGATATLAVDEVDAELTALATVLARVDLTCIRHVDVKVHRAPVVTRDALCESLLADDDV